MSFHWNLSSDDDNDDDDDENLNNSIGRSNQAARDVQDTTKIDRANDEHRNYSSTTASNILNDNQQQPNDWYRNETIPRNDFDEINDGGDDEEDEIEWEDAEYSDDEHDVDRKPAAVETQSLLQKESSTSTVELRPKIGRAHV